MMNKSTAARQRAAAWLRADRKSNPEKYRAKAKIYYAANTEMFAPRMAARWKKDPLGESWLSLKNKTKKRATPFSISKTYYKSLWTGKCACCSKEIPLPFSGSNRIDVGSFDKVDPELGYIEGNCAWLCGRCNSMKWDGGVVDHLEIAIYIAHNKPNVDPRILTKLTEIFTIIDEEETPLICLAA